jgi:hypothetical protein
MLGRYVRTLATGAVFTLVGVGLAYAVPNSLGGPRAPGRAHIALVGAKISPPGKPESAGASSDDHVPQKVRRMGRVGRPRRPR